MLEVRNRAGETADDQNRRPCRLGSPADRNAVTAAANEVDRLLAADPAAQGESRAGGLRVRIAESLMVGYMVDEEARRVVVFSVRYFGRTV